MSFLTRVSRTTLLCSKHYGSELSETFQHSLRVARFASENPLLTDEEERETAYLIGLCHDLIEDTKCTFREITEATGLDEDFVRYVLDALTKRRHEIYGEYILRLRECKSKHAYIVKLADMKDHLSETDTLTEELKEKYLHALPLLL